MMAGRVYRARKLPATVEQNGWYETLPFPSAARRVEGSLSADFAVVGAGIKQIASVT